LSASRGRAHSGQSGYTIGLLKTGGLSPTGVPPDLYPNCQVHTP
jgi:hypothetical protein